MKKDDDLKKEAISAIGFDAIHAAVIGALMEHFGDWRKFEIKVDEAESIADLVMDRLSDGR